MHQLKILWVDAFSLWSKFVNLIGNFYTLMLLLVGKVWSRRVTTFGEKQGSLLSIIWVVGYGICSTKGVGIWDLSF